MQMKNQVLGQGRLILVAQQASGTRAWLSGSQLGPSPAMLGFCVLSVILKALGLTHLTCHFSNGLSHCHTHSRAPWF